MTLIEKKWFNFVVTLFIVLNALTMGVETDHPELADVWKVFGMIFNVVFTWQMGCKLWILRCRYFCSGWNAMDFLVGCHSLTRSSWEFSWVVVVPLDPFLLCECSAC